MLGIIGGTGLYNVDWMDVFDTRKVTTPFGEPSAELRFGRVGDVKLVFLPRHGDSHEYLPSEVNYRANIWALKSVGVRRIVSFSATGSLQEEIKPGEFVLPDQYFDFVRGNRSNSFFGNGLVAHISTAEPVCKTLRSQIANSGRQLNITIHNNKTYACVDGPRLGTRAESFFLRGPAGCDLVGMTNIPEVFLAREAQICYATIAIPTDYDCWKEDPDQHVTVQKVLKRYAESLESAHALIQHVVKNHEHGKSCECHTSLEGSLMFDPQALTGDSKLMMEVLLK
ncbi:S-methyl-5'-thioadenosine phosphorylase [bacterium]|nr:S-methyl-5'-thioadenosine phosphorylase [bacterium]